MHTLSPPSRTQSPFPQSLYSCAAPWTPSRQDWLWPFPEASQTRPCMSQNLASPVYSFNESALGFIMTEVSVFLFLSCGESWHLSVLVPAIATRVILLLLAIKGHCATLSILPKEYPVGLEVGEAALSTAHTSQHVPTVCCVCRSVCWARASLSPGWRTVQPSGTTPHQEVTDGRAKLWKLRRGDDRLGWGRGEKGVAPWLLGHENIDCSYCLQGRHRQ